MADESESAKLIATDGGYRFKSGKLLITVKFSERQDAPTVEDALVKILNGRIG